MGFLIVVCVLCVAIATAGMSTAFFALHWSLAWSAAAGLVSLVTVAVAIFVFIVWVASDEYSRPVGLRYARRR